MHSISFFSGFELNSMNSIAITVGFSIVFGPKSYMLINLYKVGDSDEPGPVYDNGHVRHLRASIYHDDMGVFLSSYHMHDFEVKNTGFYEIRVQLLRADESGQPSEEILDELKTQFFVHVRDKK